MKMNIKQGKLITGLKALLASTSLPTHSTPAPPVQYSYKFSQTNIYSCTISQPLLSQFSHFYPHIEVAEVVQQFQHYLALPPQMLGKRSSEILISNHRKYCIKLMDDQSIDKYMSVSKDIWQYRQKNTNSYLIDIYRIYKIQSFKDNFRQIDYFILMPCLSPKFQDTIAVYDIKGYIQSRHLDANEFVTFKFGKDMNFVNSKQINYIRNLTKQTLCQFVEMFSNDVRFLESLNILDYSLLISFRNYGENQDNAYNQDKSQSEHKVNYVANNAVDQKEYKIKGNYNVKSRQIKLKNNKIVMQWAIIDYFQQYNSKKKAQNKVKSLFRKQVSSVQPQIYGQRFITFIHQYLIQNKFKE